MNKIFKIFLAVALSLFTVACNLDQISDIYTTEDTEASMLQTVFNETELAASLESIAIPIVRANTASETSVNLTVTLPTGLSIVGNATEVETLENASKVYSTAVTFAAGQAESGLVLDLTAMEVGSSYSGKVEIADTTVVNMNKVTMSTTFKFAKAYSWTSLGTGTFLDNFVGNYNEVEILKAEGYDIYRVMNPFPAEVLTGPDLGYGPAGEEFGIGGAPCPYVEFKVLEDGVHVSWDEKFSTTIDYSGSGDTIWLYYPADFNEANAPKAENCKFLNDEKTVVQLWGIAYIDGMGGYGDKYAPCLVGFPGSPDITEFL